LQPGSNICSINPGRTVTPPASGGTEAPTTRPGIECRGADAGATGTGMPEDGMNWADALNSIGTQPLLTGRPEP
jgi:hypothetical protein